MGNPYPGVEQHQRRRRNPGEESSHYGGLLQAGVTAECFTEDEFLKTGDRGEIDENGTLKITGRVKELFKTSKGKYIAPAPIENIINTIATSNCPWSVVLEPQAHAVVQLAEDLRPKLGDMFAKKWNPHSVPCCKK